MSWTSIVKKFSPEKPAKDTDVESCAKSKRDAEKHALTAAVAATVVRSNKGRQWEESYSNRVAYYENREMVKAFKARFNNLV